MQRDFKISLSQEFFSDVVYLSQYDSNYGIVFHVTDKYSKATDIDNMTAHFQGLRSDGLGFQYTSTASSDTVTFTIDTALTAVAGTHTGEIVFYDGNGLYYGSANVQIVVEPATHTESTIDADVTAQQTLKQELQEIVDGAAATVEASLGTLSNLTTTDKSSAVGAINEIDADVSTLNAELTDIQETFGGDVDTAVDAWLDLHPEVTTTVQDGSLTEAKLSETLKLKAIKDYVTPEMYGANGDGTTDDSSAFQRAVDTGMPVYLAEKSYVVRNITSAVPLKIIGESATIITVEAENGSNQFSNVFTSSQGINISGVTFVGLGAASSATTNRFISVIKVTGGIVSINGCKFINFDSLNTMSASDAGLDRTGMLLTAVGCDRVSITNSTFANISGDEIVWIISNNGNGEHTIANNIFDNVTGQSINVLYGNCLIKDNTFNFWNSHTSIFNINGKALIAAKNRFIGCVASDVFDCYEAGYMRCNSVLLDGNILINCKDLRFANLCADSITICNNSVSCGTFVRVANYMATQSVFPFDNSNAKQIESVTICNNYVKLFMNETSAYISAGLQIMYREGISATVVDNSLPLKNVLVVGNVFDCNPELALADLAEGYKSAFIFALGNKIDAIRIKGNTFKNIPHPFRITSSSTMLVYVQMYYERSIGFFEFGDLIVDRDELVSNTIFYYLYFRVESGYVSTYPCVAAMEYGKIYFTNLSPFSDPRRFASNNTSAVSVVEYADPYA